MKLTTKAIIWPLITFFTPIAGIIILMITLILTDTITGVWKSKKLGVPITSRGLSALVSNIFLYCGSVLLVFSVDEVLLNELMLQFFSVEYLVTKVISMIFAFVELISINENWKAVKGFDLWSRAKDLTKRAKIIKREIDDFKN
jgi:hypothetical protein